ncbi:hypothetical protein Q9189_004912 [Teloschistes chrysophthalmus]
MEAKPMVKDDEPRASKRETLEERLQKVSALFRSNLLDNVSTREELRFYYKNLRGLNDCLASTTGNLMQSPRYTQEWKDQLCYSLNICEVRLKVTTMMLATTNKLLSDGHRKNGDVGR